MFEQFIKFLYDLRRPRVTTMLDNARGNMRHVRSAAHKGQAKNKKERNRMRNKMARHSRRINRLVNA
jgi:hypothetical protein